MSEQADWPDRPERRRHTRATISAEVKLRRSSHFSYVVDAYDLSEQGCRLQFVERPLLGETVWVKLADMESIEANVRWTKDFNAGVEFVRGIDARVLQHMIRRLT